MISEEYIADFKTGYTFRVLSAGVLKKDLVNVILGVWPYTITYKTEPIDTIPSQVLIAFHILRREGKVTDEEINTAFDAITISKKNVCLVLDYIKCYFIYESMHSELKIDFEKKIHEIKLRMPDFVEVPCVSGFIESINQLKNSNVF
jgi:hypothetical protein